MTELAKDISSYRMNLRAAGRGFWSGTFDFIDFYEIAGSAIQRAFTQAWHEGAKEAGILPDELTQEELNRLRQEIITEQGRLDSLASFVENNRRGEGLLRNIFQRIELWVQAYDRIKQLAFQFASKDKKLQWKLGRTKEHCADCSNYHGRVYRASIWKKYNIHPKTWELECHGIYCQCTLTPVEADVPATPGRPPSPSFAG